MNSVLFGSLLSVHLGLQFWPDFEKQTVSFEVAANRKEPQQRVGPQDALEVFDDAEVVRALLFELRICFPFFTKLDGGILVFYQPQVEAEERSDDEPKHARQHVRRRDEVGNAVVDVVFAESDHEEPVAAVNDGLAAETGIEQHVEEVFVVVKSNAVGYPRAVVVHFQNAFVALAAMVTSIWLRSQTSLAHSNPSILFALKAGLYDS